MRIMQAALTVGTCLVLWSGPYASRAEDAGAENGIYTDVVDGKICSINEKTAEPDCGARAPRPKVRAVSCSAGPCRAVPYRAVRCRAVQCGAVPCRAVRCSALPYRAVRCSALPCRAVRDRAVPYSVVRCRVVPCRAVVAVPCRAGPCSANRSSCSTPLTHLTSPIRPVPYTPHRKHRWTTRSPGRSFRTRSSSICPCKRRSHGSTSTTSTSLKTQSTGGGRCRSS